MLHCIECGESIECPNCKATNNKLKLLEEALNKMLVADGVIKEDATPNGPELLAFSEEYFNWKTNNNNK